MPRQLDAQERHAEALRHRDHWFPLAAHALKLAQDSIADGVPRDAAFMLHQAVERAYNAVLLVLTLYAPQSPRLGILRSPADNLAPRLIESRSEERRIGTECFSTCRSRWSPCP